jgi:hypothetical protein
MRIIESSFFYKRDDGGDDMPAVIGCLLEDARETLKRDPRLSRLNYQEFNVLFAALADAARRLLGEYARIEWEYAALHIDWEYVARMITEAVVDEISNPDNGGEP